jgi:hypothetical protein
MATYFHIGIRFAHSENIVEFTKPAQTHHTTSGQYCKNNNIIIIWVMLEKNRQASEEFSLKNK